MVSSGVSWVDDRIGVEAYLFDILNGRLVLVLGASSSRRDGEKGGGWVCEEGGLPWGYSVQREVQRFINV
jgi:hypothetical protein